MESIGFPEDGSSVDFNAIFGAAYGACVCLLHLLPLPGCAFPGCDGTGDASLSRASWKLGNLETLHKLVGPSRPACWVQCLPISPARTCFSPRETLGLG